MIGMRMRQQNTSNIPQILSFTHKVSVRITAKINQQRIVNQRLRAHTDILPAQLQRSLTKLAMAKHPGDTFFRRRSQIQNFHRLPLFMLFFRLTPSILLQFLPRPKEPFALTHLFPPSSQAAHRAHSPSYRPPLLRKEPSSALRC